MFNYQLSNIAEYIGDTGGARHLLHASRKLNFLQYYSLDILVCIKCRWQISVSIANCDEFRFDQGQQKDVLLCSTPYLWCIQCHVNHMASYAQKQNNPLVHPFVGRGYDNIGWNMMGRTYRFILLLLFFPGIRDTRGCGTFQDLFVHPLQEQNRGSISEITRERERFTREGRKRGGEIN